MSQPTMPRVDLVVPYDEKDEAKRLGARWDGAARVWYVPEGCDAGAFAAWRPPTMKPNGQPGDEPNFRSDRYAIAQSSRARCYKCGALGMPVFAVLLLPGFESNADEPEWERYEEETFVCGVTCLSAAPLALLRALSGGAFMLDSHRGGEVQWQNHCGQCRALFADWYDHDEIGGAFAPASAADAARIILHCRAEPIELAARQSGGALFFESMTARR